MASSNFYKCSQTIPKLFKTSDLEISVSSKSN